MHIVDKKYDLVFIVTFVDKDTIKDFIDSLSNNHSINLLVLLVCQNNNEVQYFKSSITTIYPIVINSIVSLSKARNIAIKNFLNWGIQTKHIMFPDDDSTFDGCFFSRYKKCVCENESYIIDVYCKNSNVLFRKKTYLLGSKLTEKDWSIPCSVNMIIDLKTFLEIGFFDEKLGVGTKYGSGEDNDYYIRACKIRKYFLYEEQLYNYHPASSLIYKQNSIKQLVKRFNSYGKGVVYCLCKHKKYFSALNICFRALGGAVFSLFKLNFKLFLCYLISFFTRIILFFEIILKRSTINNL